MFEAVKYLSFLMEKAFLGLLCEDHFAADISGIESNIVGQKLEKIGKISKNHSKNIYKKHRKTYNEDNLIYQKSLMQSFITSYWYSINGWCLFKGEMMKKKAMKITLIPAYLADDR